MASESGMPNDKAARVLPLQSGGIKAKAGVPVKVYVVTYKRNWVVTRISVPLRGGVFLFPETPDDFIQKYVYSEKEIIMNFKRTILISLAALTCTAFIAGCGTSEKKSGAAAEKTEIKVGTTPGYSEQVVEFVAKEAEKEGLKVIVVPFSDYVTPNQALAQGDTDLNSFQHGPFLDAFNEKNGTDLVSIGNTYLAPLRLFSKNYKNIQDLPDGATIAIPNDPSNGGRALLLLEKNGLLKLKEGTNPVKAVVGDIAENPKHLNIIELEAPQLPRALEDCDGAIINGGYVVSAGLDPKTAIAQEDNTSPYVNIIAARRADKDNPAYQKFVKVFQTEATRKYINDNFQITLTPAF